jgi:hypothetical protein
MRCRSWVIITPPKRDDPIYASEQLTVFLPQSGFVQQAFSQLCAFCSSFWALMSVMGIFRQFDRPNFGVPG